ncbi:MAG: hypothetical protein ACTSU4_12220, partial [Promethearchaeota archaeon]
LKVYLILLSLGKNELKFTHSSLIFRTRIKCVLWFYERFHAKKIDNLKDMSYNILRTVGD